MSKWSGLNLVRSDFACPCCGDEKMDGSFLVMLDQLQDEVGFDLVVASGYRCPSHNEKISKTGRDGPHTHGLAADIRVKGRRASVLLRAAMAAGFLGIGIHQRGFKHSGNRQQVPVKQKHLHLDMIAVSHDGVRRYPDEPEIWTY